MPAFHYVGSNEVRVIQPFPLHRCAIYSIPRQVYVHNGAGAQRREVDARVVHHPGPGGGKPDLMLLEVADKVGYLR